MPEIGSDRDKELSVLRHAMSYVTTTGQMLLQLSKGGHRVNCHLLTRKGLNNTTFRALHRDERKMTLVFLFAFLYELAPVAF
jgi:hypothetical protein